MLYSIFSVWSWEFCQFYRIDFIKPFERIKNVENIENIREKS